jgi:hypothetical protein
MERGARKRGRRFPLVIDISEMDEKSQKEILKALSEKMTVRR